MPSFRSSFVLIDMADGSFNSPPPIEVPKFSPRQRLAMRTYLYVSFALLVSVATFS